MLGTVIGTVLGTGGEVESKTEMPCPLEALRGRGREMIGCHKNTHEGKGASVPFTDHLQWASH